jgi:hypothetical protein
MSREERAMRRAQYFQHKKLIDEHNRRTDVTFSSTFPRFLFISYYYSMTIDRN